MYYGILDLCVGYVENTQIVVINFPTSQSMRVRCDLKWHQFFRFFPNDSVPAASDFQIRQSKFSLGEVIPVDFHQQKILNKLEKIVVAVSKQSE
jgi:hypothetical protein